jgi:predicted DNA-binding transcriptional regulator AlpA
MTISGNSEYFTVEELSTLLGRSTRTLFRWHARRRGPPRTKIGSLVIYRRAAVESWLQSHEVAGERS